MGLYIYIYFHKAHKFDGPPKGNSEINSCPLIAFRVGLYTHRQRHTGTHTGTHTCTHRHRHKHRHRYIYMYIYICVCVCVSVCLCLCLCLCLKYMNHEATRYNPTRKAIKGQELTSESPLMDHQTYELCENEKNVPYEYVSACPTFEYLTHLSSHILCKILDLPLKYINSFPNKFRLPRFICN